MEKKLPGVFANKIDKILNNNEKVYYSNKKDEIEDRESKNDEKATNVLNSGSNTLNINQKINNIFKSNKYVYKADVVITTKEGSMIKKIIGQNKTQLITIDNELISISDILDIKFVE